MSVRRHESVVPEISYHLAGVRVEGTSVSPPQSPRSSVVNRYGYPPDRNPHPSRASSISDIDAVSFVSMVNICHILKEDPNDIQTYEPINGTKAHKSRSMTSREILVPSKLNTLSSNVYQSFEDRSNALRTLVQNHQNLQRRRVPATPRSTVSSASMRLKLHSIQTPRLDYPSHPMYKFQKILPRGITA